MRTSRIVLAGLAILAVCMLMPTAHAQTGYVSNLKVKLSTTEVQPGQPLNISVTVNTTSILSYIWARVIISNVDTGFIIHTATFNLTRPIGTPIITPGWLYTLSGNYTFVPMRPIVFGEYTVWVSVGNQSVFERINIVPSVVDFYKDLQVMEKKYEESQNRYWYIIKLVYPTAFLLSALTMVICYYLWRLPSSDKEEFKYWLLSNIDIYRLNKLKKDLRDLDRRGFAARNVPPIAKNEAIISMLRKDKQILEKLNACMQRRMERLQRLNKNANEYMQTIKEATEAIDAEIKAKNAEIEKVLESIQIEVLKANKKTKREPVVDRRRYIPLRFRRGED